MRSIFVACYLLIYGQFAHSSENWALNQISEDQVLEIANGLFEIYNDDLNSLNAPLEFSYSHQDFVPTPLISSAEIRIKERWDESTQNFKPYYDLHLLGVFTRISSMNSDGIALILCHELGHLFGGDPTVKNVFPGLDRALSVEGQADYFAAQSCFKKYAAKFETMDAKEPPLHVKVKCSSKYGVNSTQARICERTIKAGVTVLSALNQIRVYQGKPSYSFSVFSVEAKSSFQQAKIGTTLLEHPDYQCRLDTYTSGALCDKDICEEVEAKRPACWFVQ